MIDMVAVNKHPSPTLTFILYDLNVLGQFPRLNIYFAQYILYRLLLNTDCYNTYYVEYSF